MTPDAYNYQMGYAEGRDFPDDARADLLLPHLPASYKAGINDALDGRGANPPTGSKIPAAGVRTPPAAGPGANTGIYLPPPQGGAGKGSPVAPGFPTPVRQAPQYDPGRRQVPTPTRYYEVLATNPVGMMPYDYAVQLGHQGNQRFVITLLQASISFTILGDRPMDSQRGYRLSGPGGRVQAAVTRLIRTGVIPPGHADPAFYGLNGWYGAKTRTGVKILGKAELQALGLI